MEEPSVGWARLEEISGLREVWWVVDSTHVACGGCIPH